MSFEMGRSKMQKIVLVASLALSASCAQTPLPSAQDLNSGGRVLSAADIERPAADPTQLRVTDLTIGRLETGFNQTRKYLSFRLSGLADYVEFKACFQSDDGNSGCDEPQRLVQTRIGLRVFPKGKVVVEARACVEPTRTTLPGTVCGEVARHEFGQAAVIDSRLVDLAARRQQLVARIASYQQTVNGILTKFARESRACDQNDAARARVEAMRVAAEDYLVLGQAVLARTMEEGILAGLEEGLNGLAGGASLNLAGSQYGEGISSISPEGFQQLGESFAQAGARLQQEGADSSQSEGGRKLSQAGKQLMGEFVDALPTLGMALFDIFSAKDANRPFVCIAEQAANLEMTAVRTDLQRIQAEVQSLDQQITAIQGGGQ